MKQLNDYSDFRSHGLCIHCGEGLHHGSRSRDHVPTRALLDRPYPDDLPMVYACCKRYNSVKGGGAASGAVAGSSAEPSR